MKAIVCETFGPPETLKQIDLPQPVAGDDSVLVNVHAAGVGFVDGLMVQGLYQVKPKLPYYPGSEFSGSVIAVGTNVRGIQPGQRVFGLSSGGAFADYTCANVNSVAVIPDHFLLDDATAAGLPINYATALYGLRDCGHLQTGETLLILGAAGGVGSAAIAVAKAMGAHVIAGASTPDKREAALTFGADAAIDYGQENWRDQVKAAAPNGVNLVYDPVGGDLADPAFRCLSPGGRFLVVGFASGTIPKLALNLALLKRSAIIGVDWGGESRAKPTINQALFSTIMAWIESGKLQPAGVERRAMSEFATALNDQLAGRILGKLVLENKRPENT